MVIGLRLPNVSAGRGEEPTTAFTTTARQVVWFSSASVFWRWNLFGLAFFSLRNGVQPLRDLPTFPAMMHARSPHLTNGWTLYGSALRRKIALAPPNRLQRHPTRLLDYRSFTVQDRVMNLQA